MFGFDTYLLIKVRPNQPNPQRYKIIVCIYMMEKVIDLIHLTNYKELSFIMPCLSVCKTCKKYSIAKNTKQKEAQWVPHIVTVYPSESSSSSARSSAFNVTSSTSVSCSGRSSIGPGSRSSTTSIVLSSFVPSTTSGTLIYLVLNLLISLILFAILNLAHQMLFLLVFH